jgi:hypothetical protein
MPFSLQVKHFETTYKKGDVVAVRPDGFQYCEGDCLSEWVKSGRKAEDFTKPFTITYVIDYNMDGTEQEVLDLLEPYNIINHFDSILPDPKAPYRTKRYLERPEDYNNPHRVSLRDKGETYATWEEVKQYIRVRT